MNNLFITCFEFNMASGNKYYCLLENEYKNSDDCRLEDFLSIMSGGDSTTHFIKVHELKTDKIIFVQTNLIESFCLVRFDTESKRVI